MSRAFATIAVVLFLVALAGAPAPASARCPAPEDVVRSHGGLPHVKDAARAGRVVKVLLFGTAASLGRSQLAGPGGAQPGREGADAGYPKLVADAIVRTAVSVKVVVDALPTSGRTTRDMADELPRVLREHRPQLLVWQTGTVDAAMRVDLDDFGQALEDGVATAEAMGVDVLLVNLAFSAMRKAQGADDYANYMLWGAQAGGTPLVDRYRLMQTLADDGLIDLRSRTDESRRLALRTITECLSEAIGGFVATEAVTPP